MWVINPVKSVETELSREALAQPEVFIHARVPGVYTRADDRVATKGAGAGVNSADLRWSCEVSCNNALAAANFRSHWSGHVGAIARIVARPLDIQVNWRAVAQSDDVVSLPPTDDVIESRRDIVYRL